MKSFCWQPSYLGQDGDSRSNELAMKAVLQ